MNNMYNSHRAIGGPTSRLDEYIQGIRQEFESATTRAEGHDQTLQAQMNEMELVRQRVFDLERNQSIIKQRYEEDIARLRHEIEARGGPPSHTIGGSLHGPAPPSIGHGPNNLFGGIMANPPVPGNPGLAPLAQGQEQPQGPLPQQPQPGPPPQHMPQPPPGMQQGQYQPGYPQPPAVNGYGPPGPLASPGAGKPRNPVAQRGHMGTPQQTQMQPYHSPPMGRNNPSPPQQHTYPNVGNMLADLNPDEMRSDQKREGNDWYAVFNPNIRRVLDIDLVNTLVHDSVVCCVRFSHDGNYVATGCNRSAQIFEVTSGNLLVKLQDEAVEKDGDLYIRSVCFSPNGVYLATGAEDKVIRVWDIQQRKICHNFSGHEQDIYSLDFSRNGRNIASGSGDHTVRVWDIERNCEILSLEIEDGVTTVAISPRGDMVAAGSLDKSVRVWSVPAGDLIGRLEGADGHTDSVYSVAFSPDGDSLVSGSLDKTIKMWQLMPLADTRSMIGGQAIRGGRCTRTFEGHKDFVLSVALTPEGDWVLSGSKDRGVQFWNPRTGDCQLMLQGHKNSVISVAPSPKGDLFATGSGDMRARIWRYMNYR